MATATADLATAKLPARSGLRSPPRDLSSMEGGDGNPAANYLSTSPAPPQTSRPSQGYGYSQDDQPSHGEAASYLNAHPQGGYGNAPAYNQPPPPQQGYGQAYGGQQQPPPSQGGTGTRGRTLPNLRSNMVALDTAAPDMAATLVILGTSSSSSSRRRSSRTVSSLLRGVDISSTQCESRGASNMTVLWKWLALTLYKTRAAESHTRSGSFTDVCGAWKVRCTGQVKIGASAIEFPANGGIAEEAVALQFNTVWRVILCLSNSDSLRRKSPQPFSYLLDSNSIRK